MLYAHLLINAYACVDKNFSNIVFVAQILSGVL
jgi:hypothetical protein